MRAFVAGGNAFHFIDHAVTFGDLSKHRVSPPLGCFGGMIQEIIIFDIDEELVCGAVGIRCTGHGNGVRVVFQHVVRFIDNGVFGGFLCHIFGEAAPLNHKSVNDPVKDGAVVMTVIDVGQKVFHGLRGFFFIKFQKNVAHTGFYFYHFV